MDYVAYESFHRHFNCNTKIFQDFFLKFRVDILKIGLALKDSNKIPLTEVLLCASDILRDNLIECTP